MVIFGEPIIHHPKDPPMIQLNPKEQQQQQQQQQQQPSEQDHQQHQHHQEHSQQQQQRRQPQQQSHYSNADRNADTSDYHVAAFDQQQQQQQQRQQNWHRTDDTDNQTHKRRHDLLSISAASNAYRHGDASPTTGATHPSQQQPQPQPMLTFASAAAAGPTSSSYSFRVDGDDDDGDGANDDVGENEDDDGKDDDVDTDRTDERNNCNAEYSGRRREGGGVFGSDYAISSPGAGYYHSFAKRPRLDNIVADYTTYRDTSATGAGHHVNHRISSGSNNNLQQQHRHQQQRNQNSNQYDYDTDEYDDGAQIGTSLSSSSSWNDENFLYLNSSTTANAKSDQLLGDNNNNDDYDNEEGERSYSSLRLFQQQNQQPREPIVQVIDGAPAQLVMKDMLDEGGGNGASGSDIGSSMATTGGEGVGGALLDNAFGSGGGLLPGGLDTAGGGGYNNGSNSNLFFRRDCDTHGFAGGAVGDPVGTGSAGAGAGAGQPGGGWILRRWAAGGFDSTNSTSQYSKSGSSSTKTEVSSRSPNTAIGRLPSNVVHVQNQQQQLDGGQEEEEEQHQQQVSSSSLFQESASDYYHVQPTNVNQLEKLTDRVESWSLTNLKALRRNNIYATSNATARPTNTEQAARAKRDVMRALKQSSVATTTRVNNRSSNLYSSASTTSDTNDAASQQHEQQSQIYQPQESDEQRDPRSVIMESSVNSHNNNNHNTSTSSTSNVSMVVNNENDDHLYTSPSANNGSVGENSNCWPAPMDNG